MIRKIIASILIFQTLLPLSVAQNLQESDRSLLNTNRNYLRNGGFENGKADLVFPLGGIFNIAATQVAVGRIRAGWNSGSAAHYLAFNGVTTTSALANQPGEFSCLIQTPTGTATHLMRVQNGGTAVGSEPVISSTVYTQTRVFFTFPGEGVVLTPRFNSQAADEPEIRIDDCYFGLRRPDSVVAAQLDMVGTVITTSSACPVNTLPADGRAVSRSAFPALFAKLGVTHGQGDSVSTFNIPDYRGRFLRSVDSGSSRDPGAASRTAMATGGNAGNNVGSVQTDSLQGHLHGLSYTNNPNNNPGNGFVPSNGAFIGQGTAVPNGTANNPGTWPPVTDGTNGTPRTSSETRPTNAYVNYCVVTQASTPITTAGLGPGGATFYGGMTQTSAPNCTYTENTSTSLTDFIDLGLAPSCTSPWTATGLAVAPASTDYKPTFNNMPPGEYMIVISGLFFNGGAGDANIRISDGTSNTGTLAVISTTNSTLNNTLVGRLSYATPGNRTFKLQASDSAVMTPGIFNEIGGRSFTWSFYRFPTTNEVTITPNQILDMVGTVIPSAGPCPANTLLADGSSVLRATYPRLFQKIGTAHGSASGTTFNLPDYRGRFLRGVDGVAGRDPNAAARTAMNTGGATGNAVGSVQGDSMQGHFHGDIPRVNTVFAQSGGVGQLFSGVRDWVTSAPITDGVNGTPRTSSETRPINANVNYCIVAEFSTPAPIIANQVSTSNNNGERIERVRFGGASDRSNCTASPCTIYNQTGNWVTSVTRVNIGRYTLNFTAGTFSAAPTCTISSAAIGNKPIVCDADNGTTSLININCLNNTTSAFDLDIAANVICIGPR